MRTKKSLINAKFNLVFSVINLLLGFISRSIFITYLGSIYLGFNTFIMSVLGVLNLAELGIGAAVNFSLYKPLNNKDQEKINEIMFIFRVLYNKIGKTIFIVGMILIPFISNVFKNYVNIKEGLVYYLILLISASLTYKFSYKQTLMCADQNAYIINIINGSITIIKNIFQIVILLVMKNYFLWIVVGVGCNIISLLMINQAIKKKYHYVDFNIKLDYKNIKEKNVELMKNMKNTFFHKFAEVVIYQTDPIVISIFASLSETGKYANYFMVINGISQIITSLLSGFTASIGNLIADANKEKTFKIFKQLTFVGNLISTSICFCVLILINDFIMIWVGEKYIFSEIIVWVIVANLYIVLNRVFIDSFKAGFGIYWDKGAPVIEGMINLIISIFLAYKFGIIGVFIGTFISNLIIIIGWKPYTIYKYGFKRSVFEYYKDYIISVIKASVVFFVGIYFLENIIQINISNIFDLIFKAMLSITISIILLLIINIKNKYAKECFEKFKNIIIKN